MPVYFADNWSLDVDPIERTVDLTFWLTHILPKYFQNVKKTNKLEKKRTQVLYFHALPITKLQKSSQFEGWLVNIGSDVITLHLNRRDFNPIVLNNAKNDSDDEDAEYVRIKKDYIQSEEQIKSIVDNWINRVYSENTDV